MRTALVVDDNQDSRFALKHLLERDGYRVLCASGYREALRLCEKKHNTPEVAVIDVLLADDIGFRLGAALRNRYPSVGLLFVSGTPLELLARRGASVPEGIAPFVFLEKPFTREVFREGLAEALDQYPDPRDGQTPELLSAV